MLGDMKDVTERAYNYDESLSLAQDNGHSINPIQDVYKRQMDGLYTIKQRQQREIWLILQFPKRVHSLPMQMINTRCRPCLLYTSRCV